MSVPSYKDRLKSTIIRVSRSILAEEGLDGLQARKVAKLADCSVGTIYNLFGSLDMVAIAANAETLDELQAALILANRATASLEEQLDALAIAYLNFAIERKAEWRAIFEHRFSTKTAVPEWYRESQRELFAIVEQILAPTIDAQEARQEAARALFAAAHGIVSIAMDETLGEFDKAATERQLRFVLSAVARGL